MDPKSTHPCDASLATVTEARATARFAQWLYGALAAGSFAALLLILGQGWQDDQARLALFCFCIALPVFSGAVLVYGEPRRRYRVSKLLGSVPFVFVVVFVVGLGVLIRRADTAATVPLAAGLGVSIGFVIHAERRQSKRQERDAD